MMKRINYSIILLSLVLITLSGCKESDIIKPYADGTIPMQVLNLKQESTYGGAILRYDLPDDPKLSYVKAVFTLPNGKVSEVKASFYTDSLILQGYGEAGVFPVKVYSVSIGEVMSEPIEIDIEPMTPANQALVDDLKIEATYGGIKVDVSNPTKSQLSVSVMKKASDGTWQLVSTEYVKLATYSFYLRGQDAVETTYGFVAKDRWENSSEIREVTLTPILEIQCDRTKFKLYNLPTDNIERHGSFGGFEALWDNGFGESRQLYVTKPGVGMDDDGALWSTFDMGVTYKLNRMVWSPRRTGSTSQYSAGDPKSWEMYGSTEPNPDGSFDSSWTLIGRFQNLPPSGETIPTQADKEFALKGIDYTFNEGLPPFRYIRIKFLENHGGANIYTLQEIEWFGAVAE